MELSLLCGVDVLLLVGDRTLADFLLFDSAHAQALLQDLPNVSSKVTLHHSVDVRVVLQCISSITRFTVKRPDAGQSNGPLEAGRRSEARPGGRHLQSTTTSLLHPADSSASTPSLQPNSRIPASSLLKTSLAGTPTATQDPVLISTKTRASRLLRLSLTTSSTNWP